MKIKKVPMRTCIVTKEKLPKQELIRIVKFEGIVTIDETGKKNGKGCYIKKDLSVLNLAKKNKAIDRALEIEIEDSVYEHLSKLIG